MHSRARVPLRVVPLEVEAGQVMLLEVQVEAEAERVLLLEALVDAEAAEVEAAGELRLDGAEGEAEHVRESRVEMEPVAVLRGCARRLSAWP